MRILVRRIIVMLIHQGRSLVGWLLHQGKSLVDWLNHQGESVMNGKRGIVVASFVLVLGAASAGLTPGGLAGLFGTTTVADSAQTGDFTYDGQTITYAQ
jgi:hypothetical protein